MSPPIRLSRMRPVPLPQRRRHTLSHFVGRGAFPDEVLLARMRVSHAFRRLPGFVAMTHIRLIGNAWPSCRGLPFRLLSHGGTTPDTLSDVPAHARQHSFSKKPFPSLFARPPPPSTELSYPFVGLTFCTGLLRLRADTAFSSSYMIPAFMPPSLQQADSCTPEPPAYV